MDQLDFFNWYGTILLSVTFRKRLQETGIRTIIITVVKKLLYRGSR